MSNFSFVSAKFVQIQQNKTEYCATYTAICGTASPAMTLMTDFVREMTNSIKTIWTEWDSLGQYVSPNQFKGNVFVPVTWSIASKLERNVTQKFKFGLASTAIFANPVNFAGAKDVVWWTVLLAKNKVFLRDNKIIEALESQVTDKKYELGLWAWRYEKVIPENLQIMNSIVKKYIDAGLFTETSRIKDGATYNNVTSLLTQVLSAAKSFLYFDATDQFGVITRWGVDWAVIMFDDLAIQTLQMDYSCARGFTNPCDPVITDFQNNIKNLVASTKTSWSATKKIFTDALDRLGQTFSPNQQDDTYDAFKTREAELLRSMYGTTKVTPWKLIDIDYNETNGSVPDTSSTIVNTVIRSWDLMTNKDLRTSNKDLQKISPSLTSKDTFTSIMNTYLADVFASQAFDASELASFSEVKDITPAFKVLWDQVRVIKTDILGAKNTTDSLIWSLWKACELQCGGWWLCR